jgi:hypothetical protein
MISGRLLFVAFEGWNDATEAATSALRLVSEQIDSETLAGVDPEDYYDFQFTRPVLEFDESGSRQLIWPGVELLHASAEKVVERPELENLYLLLGSEPSRRWAGFTAEVLEMIEDREIDTVIFLGAMLADVPHTRPVPVFKSSNHEVFRDLLGLEQSRYEGPVGIMSVIGAALEAEGIPTISLWASVPHYVHNTTSPKGALALLSEIERLTGFTFETTALAERAFEWERGIDEVAEGDEEMAAYVSQLEKNRDAFDADQVSGDALAREFEIYLRQHPEPPEKGPAT